MVRAQPPRAHPGDLARARRAHPRDAARRDWRVRARRPRAARLCLDSPVHARVAHDAALNEQVTRVGTRIAEATGRTDYRWEFRVLEDKQANAFCLPGGKVAVYTGILPITRDDAGLAAVLGHEVSHAIARHGGERISQQLAMQGGLLATQAALAGRGGRQTQWVAAGLGAGATVGVLLPWSRL